MFLRVPNLLASLGSLALATLALATPASAQCFLPDGFTGPCCSSASPNLPTGLPPIVLPGLGICWDNCAPTTQTCVDLILGPPMPTPLCTQFKADLSVVDCSGISMMKGSVTLDYTRSWEEHQVPGTVPTQVWRFAAKVDLLPSSLGTPVCPVPTCLPIAGQAFYYGYVDYALSCSGVLEGALVLYHGCDKFIHDASYSSIPGGFHPTRTHALVGPNTAANPFVPVPVPAPAGILSSGGMRNPPIAPSDPCPVNEDAIQGAFQPLIQGCLCPIGFQPPQQAGIKTSMSGVCGGSMSSLNLFPLTPWFHLTSTSIGTWTTAASYPGPEAAHVAEGLLLYDESCNIGPTLSFDIFYGSITDGGWFTLGVPTPSPNQQFVDLASNYSLPISAPITFPLFGKVAATDHVLFLNL